MNSVTPIRFGAQPLDHATTEFRLWAPSQKKVALETADGRVFALTPVEGGWFERVLPLPSGSRYRYRVEHDGATLALPDPASRAQADDVHDFSVVVDFRSFAWQHDEWRGRPWHETVLYELHPGLLGGFEGVRGRLPALAALGITAIELMPIADFPGARNWGYDGVLPYAPDAAYGTPEDLRRLVDTAHGLGLMVFLDVVYNHLGPDGNYLGVLAPDFYRGDVPTPWGAAIDFRLPEVRAFFTLSAIQWVVDYRIDGLRLDAVHAIQERDWLDEMALAVRQAAGPHRRVHLVLENDDNIPDHLTPLPHRFDAQWNDDAHHILHVLLTGEVEGYYGDYAERPAERLARVLSQGFAYQGEASANRQGEPRGLPSSHLPVTAFVDCLQNHDQVGNRALGDRLISLAEPRALQAAVALLLMSPHIPLIFMGEETGSCSPFIFFTSHHEELADLVREGRRNEFARFPSFADPALRARIPDPNDATTYERSRPEPGPDAEAWQALYRRLLTLRAERLVPHLPGASSTGAIVLGESTVAASWQLGDTSQLVIGANFGRSTVAWLDAPSSEHLVFSSAAPHADGQIPACCTLVYLVPGLPKDLTELADQAGIAVHWTDAEGRSRQVPLRTVLSLLEALGHACHGPQAIAGSLAAIQSERVAPAMVTARVGERIAMSLPPGDPERLRCVLTLESGATRELLPAIGRADPPSMAPSLSFEGLDEPGYHRLSLSLGGPDHVVVLAIAPRKAFDAGLRRAWGTVVPLHALRPESSREGPDLGLGDFSALAALATRAAEAGAQVLAISPSHAGFAADASNFSPYSPSSRLVHNVLYADPLAIFGASAAREAARSAGIEEALAALPAGPHIDWPRAGALKLRWLRALFDREKSVDAPMTEALRLHATFEALHAYFNVLGKFDWCGWPERFQDPRSAEVAAFALEHAADIRFHAWLQRVAADGLQRAQDAATQAGMRVGLVSDLAIGMTGAGSHAWASREDLLTGLEIGAPADPMNLRGQNWGLTAFSPRALVERGFEPFIATLRAAMRHAGGVRIDHVLGLNRLWLVPRGEAAVDGAFLHYPLRDLLNLLILESHRNRAIVIGEDLGTVPPGFRESLADAGILGMRVLWLEREVDGNGFTAPEHWSTDAVAMTTTHDLPTVAGWWQGRDLEWREQIGADREPTAARSRREIDRSAFAALAPDLDPDGNGVDIAIEAVARSPASLVLVPIEDLLGLIEQPNLPGTVDEHPNWRRRLPLPADRLLSEAPASARAGRLTILRPG